mgnify:CR=1 FL=1
MIFLRFSFVRLLAVQTFILCGLSTSLSSAVLDMAFNDNLEDLAPSVDVSNQTDPRWASFGGVTGFGEIVDPDNEGIRGNTPKARFGERVLKFDSKQGGPHEPLIEQATRDYNSTNLSLTHTPSLAFSFDVRTIPDSDPAPGAGNPNVRVEMNIGGPRAGRLLFGDKDIPDGTLRAVLLGAAGKQQAGGSPTVAFSSGALQFGDWIHVRYALNIAADRYDFIEIDGTRFDNGGNGWDAAVNRSGSQNLNFAMLTQDAASSGLDGVFLDNLAVQPIPEPNAVWLTLTLFFVSLMFRKRAT